MGALPPDIHQRSSSISASHSRFPSNASVSNSITPSLRSYLDRGENSSPEPIVSTAQAIFVPRPIVHIGKGRLVGITPPKANIENPTLEPSPPLTSPDCTPPEAATGPKSAARSYEATPQACKSSAVHDPKLLEKSPLSESLKNTYGMNITVRKHRRTPRNLFARLSISGSPFKNGSPFRSASYAKTSTSEEKSAPQSTATPTKSMNISVCESEWMCRTPSPRKKQDIGRYETMWSPSLGEGKKHRLRRGTESSIKKTLWRDNPPAVVANQESHVGRGTLHKVRDTSSTSRERLTMKALDWYENVRANKGDTEFGNTPVVIDVGNQTTEIRQGWI